MVQTARLDEAFDVGELDIPIQIGIAHQFVGGTAAGERIQEGHVIGPRANYRNHRRGGQHGRNPYRGARPRPAGISQILEQPRHRSQQQRE